MDKEAARVKRVNAFVAVNGAFELNGVLFEPTGDGAVSMRSAGRSFASILNGDGQPDTDE
jgi:hypothetical protein